MKSLITNFLKAIFLVGVIASCSSDDIEEVTPENRFIRAYNHPDFNATHFALDVKQTADNGFIILAQTRVTESDFGAIYLLKTDATGDMMWEYEGDATIVSPTPGLMEIAGNFYFLTMNISGNEELSTVLMQVNEENATADIVRIFPDIQYPLHASSTADGGFITLSYNKEGEKSVISKVDASFSLSWQSDYDIQEENADETVFDHLLVTEKRLPFFTGSLEEGGYFFNGLSNLTLSLHFVDPNNGSQLGVMNGFRLDAAISALTHVGGSSFAVSRYTFGTNYILPNVEIATDIVTNSETLEGNISAELAYNADVRIKRMAIDTSNVLLYAASAKSNQVVLYAYDEVTGELKGSKHIGFSEGFEVAAIIETNDKGLAVLSTTNMAGRFRRISLFKLSEGDVKTLSGL